MMIWCFIKFYFKILQKYELVMNNFLFGFYSQLYIIGNIYLNIKNIYNLNNVE